MSAENQHRTGFLALELDGDGAHPAAWRAARHAPAERLTGERVRATVLAAESAGFHIATFSDRPLGADEGGGGGADVGGRLDAVQRAAFAGPLTRSIVLVPEVDTACTEPFHAATQLASLDYVSGGRAGWLVAAGGTERDGSAVGRRPVERGAMEQKAAASVDVDKLHYAGRGAGPDFLGTAYSVKAPAIIPPSLQGHLPVLAPAELVADGLSVRGGNSGVDAVLVTAASTQQLGAAAELMRERSKGAVAVIAELEVVLDARGQSAAERLAQLDAHAPWPGGRARYAGGAAGLVELLAGILTKADGVRLHPAVLDVDLEELSRLVLPELRRLGALSPIVPDSTFRELLGLGRPDGRYETVGN